MSIVDVILRIVTEDSDDVLDVGDMLDEYLLPMPAEVRITKLVEKFDPSSGLRPGRPPEKRAEAATWIIQFLFALGEIPAGDVYAEAAREGISAKTLRRAAKDVGVVRNPQFGGRSCAWSLPSDLEERMQRAGAAGASAASDEEVDDLLGDYYEEDEEEEQ